MALATVVRRVPRTDLAPLRQMLAESYVVDDLATVRRWLDFPATRGVYRNGRLVASGQLLALRMNLGGQVVAAGGVAAVATRSEERRRGHVALLLRQMLVEMRRRGMAYSALMPFSASFYARYGWATAEERRLASVPLAALARREKPGGRVVRGGPADIARCDRVYRRWAARYNLTLVRDTAWWRHTVLYVGAPPPRRHLFLAFDERGALDGYIVFWYRVTERVMPGDEQHVREVVVRDFAWTTPRGRTALLAFLGDQEAQAATLVWRLPPGEPVLAAVPLRRTPSVNVRLAMMARIVDVEDAFTGRSTGLPTRRAVIEVIDEDAPWNAGRWLFETNDAGRLSVRSTRRPADAVVRVGLLAQLATGYVGVEAVLDAALAEGPRPDALALVAAVSGGRETYMSDSF